MPELADWLAAHSPDTLLLAAGGVADGRTLAAVRLLGADGALVGSRLWATAESLAAPGAKQQAVRDYRRRHGAQQRVRHPAAQELAAAL